MDVCACARVFVRALVSEIRPTLMPYVPPCELNTEPKLLPISLIVCMNICGNWHFRPRTFVRSVSFDHGVKAVHRLITLFSFRFFFCERQKTGIAVIYEHMNR